MQAAPLLRALDFAAHKHRDQRRKGAERAPYINHVISVTSLLASEAGVSDEVLLIAAILHDTLEDTETKFTDIEHRFGAAVAKLVREVTDDKSLPKGERKRLQIEGAPQLSAAAKQLKIADKICNIRDITEYPPTDWSLERRREYLVWAEQVVAGCRGVNAALDRALDSTVERARVAMQLTESI
jgi:(p)ppGpp synthase/HD superfamily hydrolase